MSKTKINILEDKWLINNELTYKDKSFKGKSIEGLLFNSRMVNAIFDDENKFTKNLWRYPDTHIWDPERNTKEFIKMLPVYKSYGLISFTLNLQGGAPLGYYRLEEFKKYLITNNISVSEKNIWKDLPSQESQPWNSSGFKSNGELKENYTKRLSEIINAADENKMIVILGLFYFGQDEIISNENGVINAVNNTVNWILENKYTNVLIEINNECNVPRYEHEILQPHRVNELIKIAKNIKYRDKNLYIGTSYRGNTIPDINVIKESDFVLLHGNGVNEPKRISEMINQTRELPNWQKMPIVFNEDDHFNCFDNNNNFSQALSSYASWGYFDPGSGAGGHAALGDYKNGYQLPPINWEINTSRKKDFFKYLHEITK